MRKRLCPLLLLLPASLFGQAAPPALDHSALRNDAATPAISMKTASMKKMAGLLPLYWDAKAGKLYLEIPHLDAGGHSQQLLYTHSLPYGTGSNDLELDRGQTSAGVLVDFERTGPKVLLVEQNERFRSSASDPAELLSVSQSFPVSVLAGFKVEAEDPDGAVLVDSTDFFVRDAHNVIESLTQTQQGAYKLDALRSTIALDGTKAFPKNTEVEAELTFTLEGAARGEYVRDVTPDSHALTLREHQSFLELPGPGFTPRRFDPRAGYFPRTYRDYSVPLGESLDQNFIIRHRLIKQDPNCTKACVAVAPIQYYVDRGAPEPVRSALVDGARWWDQAFQAAGWAPGTFKVDPLPDGADPMDIRYNIIQWVHRYTRGWSYGAAIADPRTGEIIKGNVTLGSLRGRQDYLIAEALLSPYVQGKIFTPANDPMLAMVLQRLRQLAAHETGHTLGLAHNFAASAYGTVEPNGTSVMDYPHPYIALTNGVPDLSHAYAVNIGAWDKVAIEYGYREFDRASKPVEDTAALDQILNASNKRGLVYITDEDARPLGSAHPHAHLWDNGPNAADELDRILAVRSAALARFGENAIKPGTPMAQLEDTLVPLFLLHRYQTEAAAKEIGGLDYRYNLRGDGLAAPSIVPADQQRKAIAAVLKTLSPANLTLPESLLAVMPPLPPGLDRTRESFPAMTGLTFDPIATAASSADLTLALLFHPERASRLVEYHAREPQTPGLDAVIDATLESTWKAVPAIGLALEVQHTVQMRALEALLTLAQSPAASAEARAITRAKLINLGQSFAASTNPVESAAAARVRQFEQDPTKFTPAKTIEAPPGMPIGDDEQ